MVLQVDAAISTLDLWISSSVISDVLVESLIDAILAWLASSAGRASFVRFVVVPYSFLFVRFV